MNPNDLANWRCRCGRTSSIEHQVNGYCVAKDIITELESSLAQAKAEITRLQKELLEEFSTTRRYQEALEKIAAVQLDAECGILVHSIHYEKAWLDCMEIAKQALQNDEEKA